LCGRITQIILLLKGATRLMHEAIRGPQDSTRTDLSIQLLKEWKYQQPCNRGIQGFNPKEIKYIITYKGSCGLSLLLQAKCRTTCFIHTQQCQISYVFQFAKFVFRPFHLSWIIQLCVAHYVSIFVVLNITRFYSHLGHSRP
jgi:hypothetical protein